MSNIHGWNGQIRNDGKPARRPLLGVEAGTPPPAKVVPANKGMIPSRSMRSLVTVKPDVSRSVFGRTRTYVAECSAPRCKFHATYTTRNGADSAAATHRREKRFTKLHGAKEKAS